MSEGLILLYTNGEKPFVSRFYHHQKEQAQRFGLKFKCVASKTWDESIDNIEIQHDIRCTTKYAGILEAILQGIEGMADEAIVYIAEDDCLYSDLRFSKMMVQAAKNEPHRILYQLPVSFLCEQGFYTPKIEGLCLHCAYGTVAAMRHNILTKWQEYNGERDFPPSSVEPHSYPSPENPNAANKDYFTRIITFPRPLSIDFRGYGVQTWKPDGSEVTWDEDPHWGSARKIWTQFIDG